MQATPEQEAFQWQVGVWDRISQLYLHEIDSRFASVVAGAIRRADLKPGERVLDLGSGTAALAVEAARRVGTTGTVTGVDISPDMLSLAQKRVAASAHTNIELRQGRAEEIPAGDAAYDVVLASLSLMYVIDRATAAREVRRVLRPGGRFIAAVWAAPEQCDIVKFQQTAGKFAPPPPVPGVGPGALANPAPFLDQLARVGVDARVESEELGFDFDSFELAWDVLAGVTTAKLAPEQREEAKAAVQAAMWPQGHGPRHFRNVTQFIVGRVAE
jgi:SAM-dependent methyltransferase